ncbi:MAG TPA: polysaccharide deacetylase family protein [Puia sp.]|nr:polysaccharide deacetylase family protein [Puia sp.]
MKRFKKIYYSASSVFPTGVLKRMAPAASLLPYHHLVSDEEVLHVKHLYPYKNVRQFEKDLDHLLKHFTPVAVDDLAGAVLSGKSTPRGSFLLTFDDGFREVHEVIAPILSAKGIPAVFFINPAFLDNRVLFYRCKISLVIEALLAKKDQLFLLKECEGLLGGEAADAQGLLDRLIRRIKKINNLDQHLLDGLAEKLGLSFEEYLQAQRPFMTVSQVKELHEKGFAIGAHSWDHPYYDLISLEEQERQTLQSTRYVEENFSPSRRLFSFPHSDVNLSQDLFDKLLSGKTPTDVFFGIQNQLEEQPNRVLHRFNAERPDLPLARQLNGVLLLMWYRKFLNKNMVIRNHVKKA